MNKSQEQIYQEIKSKRRNLYIFIALFYIIFFSTQILVLKAGRGAFAVIVFAELALMAIVSNIMWSCPSCGTMLGKDAHPRFCTNCGVPLEAAKDGEKPIEQVSNKSKEQVYREVQNKREKIYIYLALIYISFCTSFTLLHYGHMGWFIGIICVLTILAVIPSVIFWKCPSCKKALGLGRFCKECGLQLQEINPLENEEHIHPALKTSINLLTPFVAFGITYIILLCIVAIFSKWVVDISEPASFAILFASLMIAMAVTFWQDRLKGTVRQHVWVLVMLIILLLTLIMLWVPAVSKCFI